MAGIFTRKAHVYSSAAPPSATPLQYIVPGFDGLPPMYVNESANADLQYITPSGSYLNESES